MKHQHPKHPSNPLRLGHSTPSPQQTTMSAVAASTGSPNERRASASRSFSQSQDENTKLPDELMSPNLQQVRILVVCHVSSCMFQVLFWVSENCCPHLPPGRRSLAGPQTATNCNTLGTKIITADWQLSVLNLSTRDRHILTSPAHFHSNIDSATACSQPYSFLQPDHRTCILSQSLL